MTIALITDTHYGTRSDNSVFYPYFQKNFDDAISSIKEKNVSAIIHLGDVFDRRKYINYVTAERCRKDFLEPFNDLCQSLDIPFHILAGNHDEYYRNTHKPNSLREIIGTRYSHIHIHDTSTHINIENMDLLLMPWITDSNREESMDLLNRTTARYCFGHFDIIGFELHRGLLSDHGFDSSFFSKFDGVYTGHYHRKQSSRNIHYIGAAHEFTWSDYGCPRGFSFLDLSTSDLTFHQNKRTIFEGFVYDDVNNISTIQNTKDFSRFTDKYVKVVVLKRENPYIFDTFTDSILKASPIDLTIVEDSSLFSDTMEDEIVDQAQDTPTILSSYIDGLQLPLDSNKMKKLMHTIYAEAMSLEEL